MKTDPWAGYRPDISGIQHHYDPSVDYFLDLRNYSPGSWEMDFRQLMPNDGTDIIILKSLHAAPVTHKDGDGWCIGMADLEAGRLIAYMRGHFYQASAVGIVNGAPVFLEGLPIKLDRPRNIQFYCSPQHATTIYTSAYGDIRLAHPTLKNYANQNNGATGTVSSTKFAIQNQIAPWSTETTGPFGLDDLSTVVTSWTELQRIDLGAIKSINRISAYWGYYVETAQEAASGARLGYSTDGTTRTYFSTKSNLPALKTGALWESAKVDTISARYLHVEGKAGAGANKVHAMLVIWFAWAP